MQTEFKVEKGVPIPKKQGSGRHRKYPWDTMKKGDSFFVAANGTSVERLQSILIACARRHFKITTRRESDGIRVWRIE